MTIQARVRIKEWGNSLGIVIPKELKMRENLNANEEVIITITKKDTLEDLFGKGKKLKINSQKMKDEGRRIWNL